jgi:catechol 2,3-dioxygenase-like lactoylglutathione lyase family enzyme
MVIFGVNDHYNVRQKLNLITFGVDDLERSLSFYEKGLGWKRSAKSMDGLG